MWTKLAASYPKDKDLPERAATLAALRRVVDGTMYDTLRYEFFEEQNGAGEYIALRDRRPSVRYNIVRMVVEDAASMLASEGHFPEVACDDQTTQQTLNQMLRDIRANETLIEAVILGAVGSVCIALRILNGRVYLRAMPTEYLTPYWQPDRPDELLQVVERYKVTGKQLRDAGYTVSDDDLGAKFWYQRMWDAQAETWYVPQKADDEQALPKVDRQRTVQHALGFVPMVWIKNLPGGDDIDGRPTFSVEAIHIQIESDYLLSQGGRGLKYASDPLLMIREPASSGDNQMIRRATNAIVVAEGGDAKMVEIDGAASAALLEYVKQLREFALEQMHGNRANPEKMSAAQSGRAMEMLNQSLIWLADRMRITYGESGLKQLLGKILKAAQRMQLVDPQDKAYARMVLQPVALIWPPWYAPTSDDRTADANTLRTLVDAGLMSQETATRRIAPVYDIEDPAAERAVIDTEMAARNADAQKRVQITE